MKKNTFIVSIFGLMLIHSQSNASEKKSFKVKVNNSAQRVNITKINISTTTTVPSGTCNPITIDNPAKGKTTEVNGDCSIFGQPVTQNKNDSVCDCFTSAQVIIEGTAFPSGLFGVEQIMDNTGNTTGNTILTGAKADLSFLSTFKTSGTKVIKAIFRIMNTGDNISINISDEKIEVIAPGTYRYQPMDVRKAEITLQSIMVYDTKLGEISGKWLYPTFQPEALEADAVTFKIKNITANSVHFDLFCPSINEYGNYNTEILAQDPTNVHSVLTGKTIAGIDIPAGQLKEIKLDKFCLLQKVTTQTQDKKNKYIQAYFSSIPYQGNASDNNTFIEKMPTAWNHFDSGTTYDFIPNQGGSDYVLQNEDTHQTLKFPKTISLTNKGHFPVTIAVYCANPDFKAGSNFAQLLSLPTATVQPQKSISIVLENNCGIGGINHADPNYNSPTKHRFIPINNPTLEDLKKSPFSYDNINADTYEIVPNDDDNAYEIQRK